MPRLLLVDDKERIHTIAATLLASTDVQLVCTGSAEQALELLAAGERFDVALVDIALPGMDGWTLLERLRAEPATCRMPIALMAGVLETVDPERLSQAPIQGFLKKPVELQDLAARVRRLLETPVPLQALPPEAPQAAPPRAPEPPSPFATMPAVKLADLPEMRPHGAAGPVEPAAPLADAGPAEPVAPLVAAEDLDDLLILAPEDLMPEEEASPAFAGGTALDVTLEDEPLELEELDLESLKGFVPPELPEQDIAPALPEPAEAPVPEIQSLELPPLPALEVLEPLAPAEPAPTPQPAFQLPPAPEWPPRMEEPLEPAAAPLAVEPAPEPEPPAEAGAGEEPALALDLDISEPEDAQLPDLGPMEEDQDLAPWTPGPAAPKPAAPKPAAPEPAAPEPAAPEPAAPEPAAPEPVSVPEPAPTPDQAPTEDLSDLDLEPAFQAIEVIEPPLQRIMPEPAVSVPEPAAQPAVAEEAPAAASVEAPAAAALPVATSPAVSPALPVRDLVEALKADPALMDALARAVVARLGEGALKEVAWEVMPDLAERMNRLSGL